MATSSNGIFHYTNNIHHLFNILQKGFYPSYCKETVITGDATRSFAVPIISFCDIPLSQVKDHMSKYGEYAVGLNMNWVTKHGLNPVQYLERNSIVNAGIIELINFVHGNWHESLEDDEFNHFYEKVYKGAIAVLQSIKNYSGPLVRNGTDLGEYKFYDEREWRYTPIVVADDIDKYEDIYWDEDFDEMDRKFLRKPHFEDYRLPIEGDDIRYIIVKDETEIPGLIRHLQELLHLYSNDETFQILLTKIKTAKQIKEDV